MKKLFAITMLVTHLFNLAGYRAFFQYSIRQADEQVVRQLDKNQYNENQLVEVKIKLNLPYMSDWGSYERYDGEVEIQGAHYNYVKRKVSRDTLYMLCIPNQPKTELYNGKNNYLVNVNDIPAGKANDNSSGKKNIAPDECRLQLTSHDFAITTMSLRHDDSSPSYNIPRFFMDEPGKPPEIKS